MTLPGAGATKASGTIVATAGIGISKGASALTKTSRWKVGDNIGMKTPSGNDPSFRTIRSRY